MEILSAIRVHRRLTASQIRRLFFRAENGGFAAIQTVHARLRRLIELGYLDTVVVDGGRGAGPHAYGVTTRGLRELDAPPRRRGHPGPILHDLQLAELRVNLQLELESQGGELVEWVGEGDLRSLLHGSLAPRPDGLCHWRLKGRHGVILFELDTGTEPFTVLTAKLARYGRWLRSGSHRELVPGLGLRPRIAFVAPRGRAARLVRHLRSMRNATGVFVGVDAEVIARPLDRRWWSGQTGQLGDLLQP